MRRLAASLLGLLLTLSLGVTTAAQKRRFTRDIPRDSWGQTFLREIDGYARLVRLPTMRAPLPEGEVELRVWEHDNFIIGARGFRMRRTREGWSASYFSPADVGGRNASYERRLAKPKSGWEGAWNRLVGLGVLELPDAEGIRCVSWGIRDAHSYIVETNVERAYRTYSYYYPEYAPCAQGRRMTTLVWAIVDEFGLIEIKPEDDFTLPTPRRP